MTASDTTNGAVSASQALVAAMATALSLPPPPGQEVNLVDPPSRQPVIIAVGSVTILLTLIFVISRLYFSFFVNKSSGAEDCNLNPVHTRRASVTNAS